HVVDGKDLDWAVDVVRGIGGGSLVDDPVRRGWERRQLGREPPDATGIDFDDDLKRDDFVPRPREPHGPAVPRAVARTKRMVPRITLDFFPLVHRPDTRDFGLGARGRQDERERNEGSLHSGEYR